MRTAVEGSVDVVVVVVAILFEDVPQEHQLNLQAATWCKIPEAGILEI
jgi:hypothetical protein